MKTGYLNPSGFSLRSVRRFFYNFISIFIIKESEKKEKVSNGTPVSPDLHRLYVANELMGQKGTERHLEVRPTNISRMNL